MIDRDLDGLFDPIVDTVLSTSNQPSGPPVIWDRANSSSTKDLLIPVGESGYDLFSLLSGERNGHDYEGFIGYVVGQGPDRSYSIDSLDGNWTIGEFICSGGGTRRSGRERRCSVLGNIDHELDLDVILERNGLCTLFSFAVPETVSNLYSTTQQWIPAGDRSDSTDLDAMQAEIIVAGDGRFLPSPTTALLSAISPSPSDIGRIQIPMSVVFPL
jgi:hypothetical protein